MTESPSSIEPLLTVEGLEVGFPSPRGESLGVDGVGLSLRPGEVLGLVGESGAGKSLTAAALAGLVPPPGRVLAGSATIAAERIDLRDTARLAGLRGTVVSSIFQDPLAALDPLQRIGTQLVETIRHVRRLPRRPARALAVELLDATGLPDPDAQMRRYPHQLSGGMRQRAVIALALAPAPRVLLADEPTSALDVLTQARILSLLRRFVDEDALAMLLVSHDIGAIATIADRIAVLYAGRIVEAGPTAALVRAPHHPYTRALLASVPRIRRRGAPGKDGGEPGKNGAAPGNEDAFWTAGPIPGPIPGEPPSPVATPSGCAFHPRCPQRLARCHNERPVLAGDDHHRVACWLRSTQGRPAP